MFPWPSTVRVRLTLWYSLLLGVPLVAFAFLSYAAFSRALISGTDRFIGDALEAFTRELQAERRAGLTLPQAMFTTVHEVRFRELHITIFDSTWRVVATAGPPDETPVIIDNEVMARSLRATGVAAPPVTMTLPARSGAQRLHAE